MIEVLRVPDERVNGEHTPLGFGVTTWDGGDYFVEDGDLVLVEKENGFIRGVIYRAEVPALLAALLEDTRTVDLPLVLPGFIETVTLATGEKRRCFVLPIPEGAEE